MNLNERKKYFAMWSAACLSHEWDIKDDARRKAVTLDCMKHIGGPLTDSTTAIGPDEITALFCYLAHLADQASFDKSARWVLCQEDYQTFNRAKQADWHEGALYGSGQNKLDRDRFGGKTSASGGPLESLDPDEVRKRHLTVANRHQKRQRQERNENPLGLQTAAPASAKTVPVLMPEKADVPF